MKLFICVVSEYCNFSNGKFSHSFSKLNPDLTVRLECNDVVGLLSTHDEVSVDPCLPVYLSPHEPKVEPIVLFVLILIVYHRMNYVADPPVRCYVIVDVHHHANLHDQVDVHDPLHYHVNLHDQVDVHNLLHHQPKVETIYPTLQASTTTTPDPSTCCLTNPINLSKDSSTPLINLLKSSSLPSSSSLCLLLTSSQFPSSKILWPYRWVEPEMRNVFVFISSSTPQMWNPHHASTLIFIDWPNVSLILTTSFFILSSSSTIPQPANASTCPATSSGASLASNCLWQQSYSGHQWRRPHTHAPSCGQHLNSTSLPSVVCLAS